MKISLYLSVIALFLLVQNCTPTVSPVSDDVIPARSQHKGGRQATLSAPSITTVTSDATCANCTPANATKLLINWYTSPSTIKIIGTGFDSTTVSVTDYATGLPITGYGVANSTISNTQVQIFIGANPETAVPKTMVFTITNADSVSASWTANALPVSFGKAYGTFPYFVSRERSFINKYPLPYSTVFTGNLDGNYTPQAGDAWYVWTPTSSSLQAYIRFVTQSPVVVNSSTATQKVETYSYTYNLSEWVNNAEKQGVFVQYITKTTRYRSNGTVSGTSMSYTPYVTPQNASVSKYYR